LLHRCGAQAEERCGHSSSYNSAGVGVDWTRNHQVHQVIQRLSVQCCREAAQCCRPAACARVARGDSAACVLFPAVVDSGCLAGRHDALLWCLLSAALHRFCCRPFGAECGWFPLRWRTPLVVLSWPVSCPLCRLLRWMFGV
jgi:hypothetical protein